MEYTGKMLDGQMHGQGKLVYENGECYNGDWVKGACFECAGQHRGWSLGVLLSLMVGVVLRVGNANPDNLQENVTAAASTCTSMAASLTVRFRCCGRHAVRYGREGAHLTVDHVVPIAVQGTGTTTRSTGKGRVGTPTATVSWGSGSTGRSTGPAHSSS
jgi:hypothetical protein